MASWRQVTTAALTADMLQLLQVGRGGERGQGGKSEGRSEGRGGEGGRGEGRGREGRGGIVATGYDGCAQCGDAATFAGGKGK